MEDPIVSDVVIENRAGVGSVFHDDSLAGTGKQDDPLRVSGIINEPLKITLKSDDDGYRYVFKIIYNGIENAGLRHLWGGYYRWVANGEQLYTISPSAIQPATDGEKTLGVYGTRWKTVYTATIASGRNLIVVPNKSGTMATLDDVQSGLEKCVVLSGEDGVLPESPYFGQIIIWNGNQQSPAGQMLQFKQNWYYEVINNSGDGWVDFVMDKFVKGAYFTGDNVYEVETEDGETWKIVGPEEEITVDKSFLANFGISYTYNGGLLTMAIHVHAGDGAWVAIGYSEYAFQSLKNRVSTLESQIIDVNNQIGNISAILDDINGEAI